MTTKNGLLIGLASVLSGIYVGFFTDWLHPASIEVFTEIRSPAPGRGKPSGSGVYPVSFAFDGRYRLTGLQVVKVGTTNVLWHLVPDTNSVPVKAIIYGRPVPGMKPADGRKRAESLQAGVSYELQVAAGRHRGKAVFQTKEVVTLPENTE